jgi:phosphatidylglycerophosphate synthase
MREGPRDGWILAGGLDGRPAAPSLHEIVGGVPHLLRTACEMALAGVKRITVVWLGDHPAPEVAVIARDPRLATRATLTIIEAARLPPVSADAPVLVVRGDRIFHRDMPKHAVAAWRSSEARLGKVAGEDNDAVVVTEGAIARVLVEAASRAGGLGEELARLAATGGVATSERPYLGFTTPARDARELRRAERTLVWSLRKSADGLAAKALNRRISLPISWLLARTRVHPNHVTVVAFLCALAGGIVIARGTYVAGLTGMLLVEAGSIIDGIDGELARLRFQFSQTGQWLDTLADDLGNVAYSIGVASSLAQAGRTWAVPLVACALVGFATTQAAQYFLIVKVYRSGDLAAIPWAFQSSEFLSRKSKGLWTVLAENAPKLLKRDFAITAFVVCAALGRLDIVLLVFCGGAITFFFVFWFRFFTGGLAHARAHRARLAA